eukprot:g6525.t1
MSSRAGRAASVLKSGVVYSGSAIVNGVNAITPHLAGAVDILVVRQPDGSLKSTPFYVRFGKYSSYRSKDRQVKIFINGVETDLQMHLGSYGQAYFVVETAISNLYSTVEDKVDLSGLVSPPSGYSSNEDDAPIVTEESVQFVTREAQRLIEDEEDLELSLHKNQSIESTPDLDFSRKLTKTINTAHRPCRSEGGQSENHEEDSPCSSHKSCPSFGPQGTPGSIPMSSAILEGSPSAPEEDPGQEQDENNKLEEVDGYLGDSEIPSKSETHFVGFELSLCGHLLNHDMTVIETQAVFEKYKIQRADFMINGVAISQDPHLVCRVDGVLYPWSAATPMILGTLAFGGSWVNLLQKEAIPAPPSLKQEDQVTDTSVRKVTAMSGWRLWPFRGWWENSSTAAAAAVEEETVVGQQHSIQELDSSGLLNPSDEEFGPQVDHPLTLEDQESHRIVTKKTLTPSPEQLASLCLENGQNLISFRIRGDIKQDAYVYVINWKSKLVISDIDGTVTRSDILGHLLPPIGVDWTHSGVTHLFSNIKSNGYEIMFLSSRAIAQANITRDFLHRLEQERVRMPVGPVIISPHGLLPSLYREMILRRPHDFKIGCLQDVRVLFPDHWNPFYAGFGNRETDVISYEKSGVPPSRIFTINSRGVITRGSSSSVQTSTWSSLQNINELVDSVFPCYENEDVTEIQREEFNEFHHWRIQDWFIFDDDPELRDVEKLTNSMHRLNEEDNGSMYYAPGQIAESVLRE